MSEPRALRAFIAATRCLARHLPLFFRSTPRPPLRVLCITAMDTLHVLRHGRPMAPARVRDLAMFLDFGACTNAAWDEKRLREADYADLRRQLQASDVAPLVADYLCRLWELECRRPQVGGDHRRFDEVRAYREQVVRISIATAAAIAMEAETVARGIRAIDRERNLDKVFRIVLQSAVLHDVLDYYD